MKINFDVLYKVNDLLLSTNMYCYLYKDKKNYYIYLEINSSFLTQNMKPLFFEIDSCNLVKLLNKRTNIIELLTSSDIVYYEKTTHVNGITEKNLEPIDKLNLYEYFQYIGLEYTYSQYARVLEKKLNNVLRKDKIKTLLNE